MHMHMCMCMSHLHALAHMSHVHPRGPDQRSSRTKKGQIGPERSGRERSSCTRILADGEANIVPGVMQTPSAGASPNSFIALVEAGIVVALQSLLLLPLLLYGAQTLRKTRHFYGPLRALAARATTDAYVLLLPLSRSKRYGNNYLYYKRL